MSLGSSLCAAGGAAGGLLWIVSKMPASPVHGMDAALLGAAAAGACGFVAIEVTSDQKKRK